MAEYFKRYRFVGPAKWYDAANHRRGNDAFVEDLSRSAGYAVDSFLRSAGWHLAKLGPGAASAYLAARVRWPGPVIKSDSASVALTKMRRHSGADQGWRVNIRFEINDPGRMLAHFAPRADQLRIRAGEASLAVKFDIVALTEEEAREVATAWMKDFDLALSKLALPLARFHRSIPDIVRQSTSNYWEFEPENWFLEA